jgi:two-component sensor histidine kinase
LKCASPFQAADDSIVLNILAVWRQQKFLSSIIINLIESAFIFLQALKFEGQSKRNGQPEYFLSPYANSDSNVNDEEDDEDDKSDIPLQCLPQLNNEQFNCLTAINGLLQILYACVPEILIQADHAQFDPIKHIINLALSLEPKRWLPLLASVFSNFFTEPNDYLPYYRLIPEIHRLSFLEYLQPHFKEHSLYLSIINLLNYCPLTDGLRPAMLYKQQQWQHQLQLIFKTNVTNKDLKNAQHHKQWTVTSYDFENNNTAKLRYYLLHPEISKYLFNDDGSFRVSREKCNDCQSELSFVIGDSEFVAKVGPKFPAIAGSINYLSWLICGDSSTDNYLCHFQRGKESVVVQFFQKTYKQPIFSKEDFAHLDLGKMWRRFFNYLDELYNFYQLLFPTASKNSYNYNISLSETLVIDLWNRAQNLQYTVKHAQKNLETIIDASLIEKINHDLLDYYHSFATKSALVELNSKKAILSPKQALNILNCLENEQLQSIINSIKLGNSDGIQQFQLLTPRSQLHLLDNITQSQHLHPHNKKWNNQQLSCLLQAITGVYITELDLSLFASILTDELFLTVLQNNGIHLLELNISGCYLISQNMINKIAKYCPKLQSLTINQWPEEYFILNNDFICLRNLEINTCPKLHQLRLDTPILQSLHAQHNTALSALQLNTKQLIELNLTECTSLPESTLMHCLPTFSTLKKLTLKGCKKIHHIKFREKYPSLLGQPFNKYKGKFKENLKIDYRINRKRLATVYHRVKNSIKSIGKTKV